MLADDAGEHFLERPQSAFVNEQVGELRAELGGNRVGNAEQRLVPMFGIGVLERLQCLFVFRRRHLLQQLAQFQIL